MEITIFVEVASLAFLLGALLIRYMRHSFWLVEHLRNQLRDLANDLRRSNQAQEERTEALSTGLNRAIEQMLERHKNERIEGEHFILQRLAITEESVFRKVSTLLAQLQSEISGLLAANASDNRNNLSALRETQERLTSQVLELLAERVQQVGMEVLARTSELVCRDLESYHDDVVTKLTEFPELLKTLEDRLQQAGGQALARTRKLVRHDFESYRSDIGPSLAEISNAANALREQQRQDAAVIASLVDSQGQNSQLLEASVQHILQHVHALHQETNETRSLVVDRLPRAPQPEGLGALRRANLKSLTADSIMGLKKNLTAAKPLFEAARPEIENAMAPIARNLPDAHLEVVFATVAASMFAPYGPSTARSYEKIVTEKSLNCMNYGALVGYITDALGWSAHENLIFAGFHGRAVQNHLQLFFNFDGMQFLLDPTTALIARTSFDDLLAGKPVASVDIASFYRGDDTIIENLLERVMQALTGGGYRPSDLYYYFSSFSEWSKAIAEYHKLCGTDLVRAMSLFTTPGASGLKKWAANQTLKSDSENNF